MKKELQETINDLITGRRALTDAELNQVSGGVIGDTEANLLILIIRSVKKDGTYSKEYTMDFFRNADMYGETSALKNVTPEEAADFCNSHWDLIN